MVQITKLQELDWEISHTHNRHSRPYIRTHTLYIGWCSSDAFHIFYQLKVVGEIFPSFFFCKLYR